MTFGTCEYDQSNFILILKLNLRRFKMEKKDYGKLFLGSILILAGVFMVLANFFKLSIFGVLFLPSLGLIFIIWSIFSKEPELLIPGGIIEGLGLGIVFVVLFKSISEPSKGGLFFIGFAIGWLLITVLSKVIFNKNVLWPLIPSILLFVFGFIIFLGERGLTILQNFNFLWPYLLIAAGIIVIFTFFKTKK